MKAWKLEKLGGQLFLVDLPTPEVRPGTVRVRMEVSVLMSYMRDYVAGKLPIYNAPKEPFIPGGNGIGMITAVGRDVWHLQPGQRVAISAHVVADENVEERGQFLLGVTAVGDVAVAMQASFPDGTLAEEVVLPKSIVTPVVGLDHVTSTELATTMRHLVPYGGLLRGRLAPGETVVVVGATGAYGSAASLLALALGAERVVAAGRNQDALAQLVRLGKERVVPVGLCGDLAADTKALREAAGGGAHLAFDMVGAARDPNATLAALRSLRQRGRLVLMGSMTVPLPLSYLELMMNGWEILGQFMYPADAYLRLLALVRGGLLDPRAITVRTYPLAELPSAMDAAARASGLECVALDHGAK
ncbi:Alcohol dehydrogenase, zinc-binding [Labilithrix luteola]|uniref:Alcohol dehydrogenase, zinc-binding n=1 Tax=Labilithrix luteola TaxID=1391654 RepID=A0A0K1PPT8_9BACT|nr:zinc-binding dehydrogenase [Labilithrix luteola]AKU95555.1 Alcohol dehydrogenase, zinc-binding [Labilithrix luteola]